MGIQQQHEANGDDGSSQILLSSLLSAKDRDFLIRSNGDQVKIASLTTGRPLGLYFSASGCQPSQKFTPLLLEAYDELKPDFEVVLVSSDIDDESFYQYFSKMPWLAVPFSDSYSRDSLTELFKVKATPHLVILGGEGKVSCHRGKKIITKYGSRAYPFTEEKLNSLIEEQVTAKQNQTVTSLLASPARDYLISNDGTKTDVQELQGKVVCLYIAVHAAPSCAEFTPKLVDFYNKVKADGEDDNFEVVLVSFDQTEEKFRTWFDTMPWLALPFQDKTCGKLLDYFQLRSVPTVIVLGRDGKTMHPNVAEFIEDFGSGCYPFGPEKLAELAEVKKARTAAEEESQTLESILVHGDKDFVIDNRGSKVPVSELVGKNIILYFSAHWCPPCRKFTPKLASMYHEIKAKDNNFEVVFISSDKDESSFDEYFSTMPWLAIPFDPEIKAILNKKFKISGIPAAIAIGPSGQTSSTKVRDALSVHGVDAYPFTEEYLKQLEEKLDEKANRDWPSKVKLEELHEHELVRKKASLYECNGCDEIGGAWSYSCEPCDFDLHPKCALREGEVGGDGKEEEGKKEEGWICEGDVCRKA